MGYFSKKLAKQLKRPSGIFGNLVAEKMQQRNNNTYKWMISNMILPESGNVLEIGYGTGKVLIEISKIYPNINMYGIDFSNVMYKKAIKNMAHLEGEERIKLSFGNILDYNPDIKFHVIYGINVIYFWDDLIPYLTKIHSLLNDSGCVYFYLTDSNDLKSMPVTNTDIFNKHSIDEIQKIAETCRFKECFAITGERESRKGYCLKLTK